MANGITRQILGELTLEKKKGKALTKGLWEKFNPEAIANTKPKTQKITQKCVKGG